MGPESGNRWGRRIGWLVLIWVLGVGMLALVALLIRLAMRAAGMSG